MIDLLIKRADELMEIVYSIQLRRKQQADKEKANKRFLL